VKQLKAGAAAGSITPVKSQFLYGYPHVERWSTGVHDPLLSSAIYLNDGHNDCIISANDIVGFDKPLIQQIKAGIFEQTGIPLDRIFISATHTHSGPRTVMHNSSEADPVVPPPDQEYVDYLVKQVINTAVKAASNPEPVSVEFSLGNAEGIGTNRRRPDGPSDLSVPVFLLRRNGGDPLACMFVYSMHPTVLHEDSTLISADFPGMARKYLQKQVFSASAPVPEAPAPAALPVPAPAPAPAPVPTLMLMGASGNQSPRHVTKANTFAEAARIGEILGKAVASAISHAAPIPSPHLTVRHKPVDLPRKTYPSITEARERLQQSAARLKKLQKAGTHPQETRTAECDWFGAEEILTLARLNEEGKLEETYRSILPADIQMIGIGDRFLMGWPCEIFVEYQLEFKKHFPQAYPVSLANGELHGYIVTREAADEGGYEASNTLWGPEAGEKLLEESVRLMES
jgi:neutral ceramidase